VTGYPLLLDLAGRPVVVVGGGRVALRRVRGLLEAGAAVHVVAPQVLPELAALGVEVHRRRYAHSDLDGAWLAQACTDDPVVNAAVAAEAERRRVPCVRADAGGSGTAVPAPAGTPQSGTPQAGIPRSDPVRPGPAESATVRSDPVRPGPAESATIHSGTVQSATAEFGTMHSGTAWTPAVVRSHGITVAVNAGGDPARAAAIRDAVARLLDLGELPVRPRRQPERGRVALVGGGPGDPELITVRGRRLLAEADVVVVDRLAPRALLDSLPPGVEVVDVGKAAHGHGPTQQEINAVLVNRARAGKRVVRLKGGDPFVFGRGGEEVLACIAAGVPVEVVPGVTSALAAPACAGIPVTHRGVASDVAVVSGHLDPSQPGSTVDWQALADGPATLVLLMALESLDTITAELVKRGRPADTPVAVIHNATLPDQQVLTGTLGAIAEQVTRSGLRPPAVIVIGEVVRLRDRLWGDTPPNPEAGD
jgi:uroporphyrin-III C-methyltransferase/precorrin-2 dehydrogenase/sirohydrochlorin ferrochelatase